MTSDVGFGEQDSGEQYSMVSWCGNADASFPSLFCVVAALALLIIVCNATPSWNAIYFVRVNTGLAGEARLGLYGASYRIARGSWTAIGSQLGYGDNDLPDFLGDGLDILYSVTVAMGVMHPLTAVVVLLAALFSFGGFILSVIGAILA